MITRFRLVSCIRQFNPIPMPRPRTRCTQCPTRQSPCLLVVPTNARPRDRNELPLDGSVNHPQSTESTVVLSHRTTPARFRAGRPPRPHTWASSVSAASFPASRSSSRVRVTWSRSESFRRKGFGTAGSGRAGGGRVLRAPRGQVLLDPRQRDLQPVEGVGAAIQVRGRLLTAGDFVDQRGALHRVAELRVVGDADHSKVTCAGVPS